MPHNKGNVEDQGDDNPIHMEGVPVAEFEAFLQLILASESRLEILPHARTPEMRMACMVAVTRWDSPDLRSSLLKNIAQCNDPVLHLQVARQFEMDGWIWPAIFPLCIQQESLTRSQSIALSQHPIVLNRLEYLRRGLAKAHHDVLTLVQREIHIRKAIHDEYGLEEPSTSEIKPPRSGYGIWIRDKD